MNLANSPIRVLGASAAPLWHGSYVVATQGLATDHYVAVSPDQALNNKLIPPLAAYGGSDVMGPLMGWTESGGDSSTGGNGGDGGDGKSKKTVSIQLRSNGQGSLVFDVNGQLITFRPQKNYETQKGMEEMITRRWPLFKGLEPCTQRYIKSIMSGEICCVPGILETFIDESKDVLTGNAFVYLGRLVKFVGDLANYKLFAVLQGNEPFDDKFNLRFDDRGVLKLQALNKRLLPWEIHRILQIHAPFLNVLLATEQIRLCRLVTRKCLFSGDLAAMAKWRRMLVYPDQNYTEFVSSVREFLAKHAGEVVEDFRRKIVRGVGNMLMFYEQAHEMARRAEMFSFLLRNSSYEQIDPKDYYMCARDLVMNSTRNGRAYGNTIVGDYEINVGRPPVPKDVMLMYQAYLWMEQVEIIGHQELEWQMLQKFMRMFIDDRLDSPAEEIGQFMSVDSQFLPRLFSSLGGA